MNARILFRFSALTLFPGLAAGLVLLPACGDDGNAGGRAEDTFSSPDTARPPKDEACLNAGFNQACDDGNPCTTNDKCIDERCVGALDSCDDGNLCTDDICDPVAGCLNTNNQAICDDGDACTTGDICGGGACGGDPASFVTCDDGDPCTVNDECLEGICGGQANSCDDGNPCTVDSCDPTHADAVNGCLNVARVGSCDDENPCTQDDVCTEAGSCAGVIAVGIPCDDDDLCTENSACTEQGQCRGAAITCEDNDICTMNECSPELGCRFPPAPGVSCDDGDRCTLTDVCDANGACAGAPRQCQGADLCVAGTCDGATGECQQEAVDCEDDNVCTDDSCAPAIGCVNAPNTDECADGDKCTVNDRCAGGVCVGQEVSCDTSGDTQCAGNSCNPSTGQCEVKNFDGSLCVDGELCTTSDVCSGGVCVGIPANCTDGDPCTVDSCNPNTGSCEYETLSQQECGDVALDRSNEYRVLVDLPLLNNHESIIAAAEAHCLYYVTNPAPYDGGLSPHAEEAGLEGFTGAGFGQRLDAAGYTGSPMFEVMAFINDPVVSIDEWVATLYHRIPFIVPAAFDMGYGGAENDNRRCDTVDFGRNPINDPAWEGLIIPFPPNGLAGVPTTWDGFENPQPPLPNPYPSGPILTVTFAQENGSPNVSVLGSVINGPDGPVPHVAGDPQSDPDLCCGIITLYPNAPLETFTTYTVTLDYSRNGVQGSYEWSFTTGNDENRYFIQ